MNETLETILERRSIRSYQQKQISEQELDSVLQAAEYAPSAMNQQSSKFVVVQNKEIMQKLIELGKKATNNEKSPFYGAPTLILVFAEKDNIAPINDASLALENMFLAATSLNLASCWIHCVNAIFRTDEGKMLQLEMGVGDEYMIVGSCILGYTDNKIPEALPRKKDFVIKIK